MTDVRRYHDTIVIACPERLSPVVAGVLVVDRVRALIPILDAQAREVLAVTYPRSTLIGVEWTLATKPEHVSEWPLPHDCDNCRDGKYKAIAALTVDPDRTIALGNMTCEEPAT